MNFPIEKGAITEVHLPLFFALLYIYVMLKYDIIVRTDQIYIRIDQFYYENAN